MYHDQEREEGPTAVHAPRVRSSRGLIQSAWIGDRRSRGLLGRGREELLFGSNGGAASGQVVVPGCALVGTWYNPVGCCHISLTREHGIHNFTGSVAIHPLHGQFGSPRTWVRVDYLLVDGGFKLGPKSTRCGFLIISLEFPVSLKAAHPQHTSIDYALKDIAATEASEFWEREGGFFGGACVNFKCFPAIY